MPEGEGERGANDRTQNARRGDKDDACISPAHVYQVKRMRTNEYTETAKIVDRGFSVLITK